MKGKREQKKVGFISQARRGHASQGRLQPLMTGLVQHCKEDCTTILRGHTAGHAQKSRHRFLGALYA
jgi:hypothetical protein